MDIETTKKESGASRKERLKALREAKKLLDEEHGQPVLKFRNYELRDEGISHVKVKQQDRRGEHLLCSFHRRNLLPSKSHHSIPLHEGLSEVAPKKLNFDLKRDVEDKLQLLERRTQRALVELQQAEERRRMQLEGNVADNEGSSENLSDSEET